MELESPLHENYYAIFIYYFGGLGRNTPDCWNEVRKSRTSLAMNTDTIQEQHTPC